MKLALTCPLQSRETATSYTSRLAYLNYAGTAYDFCNDVGLNWRKLIYGETAEIRRLAELSGASESCLQRFSFRTNIDQYVRIGRETLHKASVHRTTLKVCPICIRNAVSESGFSAAYRKVDWQLVSTRSCEYHNVKLIRLPAKSLSYQTYDVVPFVEKYWQIVSTAADTPTYLRPSSLEAYIRERLSGKIGNLWIDKLPLPVAIRASELFGARQLFGRDARTNDLTDIDFHESGHVGFEILRRGPEHIRGVLLEFKEEEKYNQATYNRDMGCIYLWLSSYKSLSGIKPLMSLVRHHIIENYGLTVGAIVLGQRVLQPKRFTKLAVKRQLCVRRERLDTLIERLRNDKVSGDEWKNTLSIEQVQLLRTEFSDLVSIREAENILGCSFKHIINMINIGILKRQSSNCERPFISRTQLEEVSWKIQELQPDFADSGLVPIQKLCHLIKMPITDIFYLFLRGHFSTARRDPSLTGLAALCLDQGELRASLSQSDRPDPTLNDAAKEMKISMKIMKRLGDLGEIEIYKGRNKTNNYLQRFITIESLIYFREKYILPWEIVKLSGKSRNYIYNLLDNIRILPVFDTNIGKKIYNRRDIMIAISSIA